MVQTGPTPLPTRTRFAPGTLLSYEAQSGDTLPAVASHFNTTVAEILAENPDLPTDLTTLPPGYPMQIPAYYVPLTGPTFHALPDSEVVYGPSAIGFDFEGEIRARPGFLAEMEDFAYKRQRKAWDVVKVIAENYSINPRLLLALMEHQTQALTKPFPEGQDETHIMGVQEGGYEGLFWQLIWMAERINDGYYGWRTGSLQEFELTDGLLVRPDPWLNAGSVALQHLFAGLYGGEAFEKVVGPQGFYQTYRELWGDPFEEVQQVIPGNLQQPELGLPFVPNHVWTYTAGPHFSWGKSLPLGALDFGPPSDARGCILSNEWITAPADGVIARSGEAVVVLDLDGDGDERSGWTLFFFHVESRGRIAQGSDVAKGEHLGHPSCEGGRATGTHVHIARRFNGEWIPAGGPLAFEMGGWVAAYGEIPYEGTMTKGSKVVPASDVSAAENRILYELPQ
jgi:LysM repeat protein